MTISPYDQIADEYYSERHVTSRNFDEATKAAFSATSVNLPLDGLVLEFGAGRGRSTEYLKIESNRIIQSDSSIKMLSLPDREECYLRVVSDAHTTPFLSSEFNICTAFLCDPFWSLNFLLEAYRVTKPGGYFIATMPSYVWGMPLRQQLGIETNTTTFVKASSDKVDVPSFLFSTKQILSHLKSSGFSKDIHISSWKLPKHIDKISPHIVISAELQNLSPYDLEIVDLIIAQK